MVCTFRKALVLIMLTTQCVFAEEKIDTLNPLIIQKAKHGVVTVVNNIRKAAYNHVYDRSASGFLIDKQRGIFLTNAHVANNTLVNNITLTTFNGRELSATFVYSDPMQDFAFLRVDPKSIPQDLEELKLMDAELKTYQPVFLVGNNEGKSFSVQTGNVVSQYDSVGFFSGQVISISLNTRGGSSGSPVMDYQGNVVALNFAGTDTYASALKISYILEALPYIQKSQLPVRNTLGLIFAYQSLDKAIKYQNFPDDVSAEYMKNYPDASNKALTIDQVLGDSPLVGILEPGDIILQVNEKAIGPNLYQLDRLINSASKLDLVLYRNGKKIKVAVKPVAADKHRINRMVVFGNAVFYEVDNFISLVTGAKEGELFVSCIDSTSAFNNLAPIYGLDSSYSYLNGLRMIKIDGFNNQKVSNLDELIKVIPQLVAKKNFMINYRKYLFYISEMNYVPMSNHNYFSTPIEYTSYGDEPMELSFDKVSLQWKSKAILG